LLKPRAQWEGKIISILSLIQFDELVPLEFITLCCCHHSPQPEKRLMFAVLEDAVFCFQTHVASQDVIGKKLFAEAEHWLLDENTDWPFSFTNICQEIRLDKDLVRAALMRWKYTTAGEISLESPSPRIAPAEYQSGSRHIVARKSPKARAVG
jgi:hypothetical protein